MNDAVSSDHFLPMRRFRCVEGTVKTRLHVTCLYEIRRNIAEDLTDLEYDLIFVWKGRDDYGIDMWNGVCYRLSAAGDGYDGQMHEINMDVPREAVELCPIREVDIKYTDPESHWLPRMVIR